MAASKSAFNAAGGVRDSHFLKNPRLKPCLGCVYTYSFSTSCNAIKLGSQRHDNQAAAHATVVVNILVLHHVTEADYHICLLMMSDMVAEAGNRQAEGRPGPSPEWEAALGKEAYFHWHADGKISKVMEHSLLGRLSGGVLSFP